MKRFYCLTCKKIKRAHKLPGSIVDPKAAPEKRIGICKWHTDQDTGKTHAQSIGRGRVRHKITGMKRISAAAAKSKSKKG